MPQTTEEKKPAVRQRSIQRQHPAEGLITAKRAFWSGPPDVSEQLCCRTGCRIKESPVKPVLRPGREGAGWCREPAAARWALPPPGHPVQSCTPGRAGAVLHPDPSPAAGRSSLCSGWDERGLAVLQVTGGLLPVPCTALSVLGVNV